MFRFFICELITGDVLDELPMEIETDLTRGLRQYGEGTLRFPLYDSTGQLVSPTWENNLLPGRTLVVVTDQNKNILWGGQITQRLRSLMEPIVRFPCRTLEWAFVGRYVPTLDYRGKDQTSVIFKGLMQAADTAGIGLEYDCPASGVLRDATYADDEQARIYDRVNELAGLENGFDWTIDLEWYDDTQTRVRKIVRTRYPYMGNRDTNPVHVFEHGNNLVDVSYDESWDSDDAATHVRAIGDGEGTSKIMSDAVVDTLRETMGWPRREVRKSFSGVTSKATANSHAARVAAQLFGGQEIATVTARDPGVGEDFTRLSEITMGDTARILVKTGHLNLDVVYPVVGWSLSPGTDATYKPWLAKIGED